MIVNKAINNYLRQLSEKRIRCGIISRMMAYGLNSININSIHDGSEVFLQKVKEFIAWSDKFDASIKEATLED